MMGTLAPLKSYSWRPERSHLLCGATVDTPEELLVSQSANQVRPRPDGIYANFGMRAACVTSFSSSFLLRSCSSWSILSWASRCSHPFASAKASASSRAAHSSTATRKRDDLTVRALSREVSRKAQRVLMFDQILQILVK